MNDGSRMAGASSGQAAIKRRTASLSVASNSALILLKVIAGTLTGSVALLTEAVHSSIDLIASIVAVGVKALIDIGQKVQLNGHTFTVVGTLKAKGSNGAQDQDDVMMAPITAVQNNLTGPASTYSQIVVEARSRAAQNAIRQIESRR